jgi:hypothetical protein
VKIVTRAEAKAAGLKRYFTGVPCKHGHVSDRWVIDGKCKSCIDARTARWRDANKEYVHASQKAYREAHAEEQKAYIAKWRKDNPERLQFLADRRLKLHRDDIVAKSKVYYEKNKERIAVRAKEYRKKNKEFIYASICRWKKANPARARAGKALRRLHEQVQRCECCTNAQLAEVYAKAVQGVHDVDHIVPLGLGGLHCVKNLQVLTKEEHKIKTTKDRAAIREYKKKLKEELAWLEIDP